MKAICFDPDSEPPISAVPGGLARTERLVLSAADGARLSAFRADAADPTGAGMLVLPDYHGLTHYYEQLTIRIAERGIDAIAIDYYGRTAPDEERDASFEHGSHVEQTTWQGLQADVAAAAAELRSSRAVPSLFSIGFCFGGRVSFLLASSATMRMAGVIGFYGWPVGPFGNGIPEPMEAAGDLDAPLLGIFGGADAKIAPQDVDSFEDALTAAGVEHRLVTFSGAPHSFFDHEQEAHAAASREAWAEVEAFVAGHSGAAGN
jgi:carboxymethylenebutenolidase